MQFNVNTKLCVNGPVVIHITQIHKQGTEELRHCVNISHGPVLKSQSTCIFYAKIAFMRRRCMSKWLSHKHIINFVANPKSL